MNDKLNRPTVKISTVQSLLVKQGFPDETPLIIGSLMPDSNQFYVVFSGRTEFEKVLFPLLEWPDGLDSAAVREFFNEIDL